MKFAIHTLVFYGADQLHLMIQNTGPYVDKIYLSHSKIPWSAYNAEAKEKYNSAADASMVNSLPFKEKIVWLEGVWETEEAQRNHSLLRAREDGIDYMIIQDVDEYYLPQDFLANLEGIRRNPMYGSYRCPWTVFWKSTDYVIQVREHEGVKVTTVTTCPNFAVNVQREDVKFVNRRLVNGINQSYKLPGLCYHLAWVLSDEEVLRKIETWGHSHQFDRKKWYRHKWLAWTPSTKFIGHITRANYLQAVPFKGMLPIELNNFPKKAHQTIPLSLGERVDNAFLDFLSWLRLMLSKLKHG